MTVLEPLCTANLPLELVSRCLDVETSLLIWCVLGCVLAWQTGTL